MDELSVGQEDVKQHWTTEGGEKASEWEEVVKGGGPLRGRRVIYTEEGGKRRDLMNQKRTSARKVG